MVVHLHEAMVYLVEECEIVVEQHAAAEAVSLVAACVAVEDSLAAECEAAEVDSLEAEEDAGRYPLPTSPRERGRVSGFKFQV